MITCDLCGEPKDCLQKVIDGKEYDFCAECWNLLARKLTGKGRTKNREFVLLPTPRTVSERKAGEPEPQPGEPPIIWGALDTSFQLLESKSLLAG